MRVDCDMGSCDLDCLQRLNFKCQQNLESVVKII